MIFSSIDFFEWYLLDCLMLSYKSATVDSCHMSLETRIYI